MPGVLVVAYRAVEKRTQPGDVIPGAIAGTVTPAAADHDSEFAFVIVAGRNAGTNQRLSVTDQTRREADEDERVVRHIAAHFLDVRPVVDTDAKNLAGLRNRRQQADSVHGQRHGLDRVCEPGERIARQCRAQIGIAGRKLGTNRTHGIPVHEAVTMPAVDLETYAAQA